MQSCAGMHLVLGANNFSISWRGREIAYISGSGLFPRVISTSISAAGRRSVRINWNMHSTPDV